MLQNLFFHWIEMAYKNTTLPFIFSKPVLIILKIIVKGFKLTWAESLSELFWLPFVCL